MSCYYGDPCPIIVEPRCKPEQPALCCYPCLPSCAKVVYCEKPEDKGRECCYRAEKSRKHKPCDYKPPRRSCSRHEEDYYDEPCCRAEPCCRPEPPYNPCEKSHRDHQPCCKPVKTKYVMPCYRYEDGRIEPYVPSIHGALATSAYKRNGLQDHLFGKGGVFRNICAGPAGCEKCVYQKIEPLKVVYKKITNECSPTVKKKKSICQK